MTEQSIDKKLTIDEAYDAMYDYLDRYWQKTRSIDIGGMLGDMSLLGSGATADSAAWEYWMESIEKILEQNKNLFQSQELINEKLTIKEAYAAMFDYIESFFVWTDLDEKQLFLKGMKVLENGLPVDHVVWENWIKSAQRILNQNPRVRPRLTLIKED